MDLQIITYIHTCIHTYTPTRPYIYNIFIYSFIDVCMTYIYNILCKTIASTSEKYPLVSTASSGCG